MKSPFVLPINSVILAGIIGFSSLASANAVNCGGILKNDKRFTKTRPEVELFKFDMPGLKIGTVSDSTLATGATLFLFDNGATAVSDARGGSVASVETSLLEEGSYSNQIDGIMFTGGSTMGLEATQGPRRRIFKERSQRAGDFDFIPSIPGAVVYDYGARIEPTQDKLVHPNLILGAAAYDNAEEGHMLIGRAGAGTSTTANKISRAAIWGGQGAAFKEIEFRDGSKMKLLAAVVVNAHGNIQLPPNVKVDESTLQALREATANQENGHKQNTTLSLIITDVKLDRSQLTRLARMVHTNMAGMISPFQSYTDGDIIFAVSLQQKDLPATSAGQAYVREEKLQTEASALMHEAILNSVRVANKLGVPQGHVD